MRKFLLMTALCLGLATVAQADEAGIQSVISSQIEAFQVDDFDTAFTFASPTIKRLFGSSDRFGAMVQRGYPMVWRPAKVEYLGLDTIQGLLVQQVLITDQSGTLHTLAYQMVETPEGWQINGVQILRAPQVGA